MPKGNGQAATVLLVDAQPLVRRGLRSLLESETGIAVTGEAGDAEEALEKVRALTPDIVVIGIELPKLNGIEATRCILAEVPATKIIALSMHSEKHFVEAMLKTGASGYVLKEDAPEELVQAIYAVLRGESFLSKPILGTVIAGYRQLAPAGSAPQGVAVAESLLLQTKLHRPVTPPDLLPRTRLLDRLSIGQTRQLTLVSAPAGYGKSVLLSSWLDSCDWPGAWLSLDQEDSDLRQFLNYFVAAVRGLFPQACKQTLSLASALQLPPVAALVVSLSNELDEIDKPFILVLDDYHQIDTWSAVNELLSQLLTHPPRPLHLAIASRRDPPLPLVTLRARRQISEIRMQDLRFNLAETRALLEQTADFSASDDALLNLQQEMEGWVVGLRLVFLALPQIEDREGFLKTLQGGVQQTQAYMIQEVVARQTPPMRDWLLQSAILDRFCAPLCDALCAVGTAAGAAGFDGIRFIETLHEGNLFAIALDAAGEWFRYHHLFQHLLLGELAKRMTADEIAVLHSRASQWFESRGLIDEAIQHALKAGDVVAAIEIFENQRHAEMNRDRWHIVEKWLTRLPADIRQLRPEILLAQAWIAHFRFRLQEIPPLLDRAEALLGKGKGKEKEKMSMSGEAALSGEINFFRGILCYLQGQSEHARKHFEQALRQVLPNQLLVRAAAELFLAMSRHMNGHGDMALQTLNEHIEQGRPLGNLYLSRVMVGVVYIRLLNGDLAPALASVQRLQTLTAIDDNAHGLAWSYYIQGCCHLQSFNLAEALPAFTAAAQNCHILHARAAVDCLAGLALTRQFMQQPEQAAETMKQLADYAREANDPACLAVADSCQSRLALLQGGVMPAVAAHQPAAVQVPAGSLFIWLDVPRITQARVLIATGSGENLRRAQELLQSLRRQTETWHFDGQAIEILVLQSVTLEKLGHAGEALTALARALALAEPGVWIRPFVEVGPTMANMLKRLADKQGGTKYLRLILAAFRTGEASPLAAAVVVPRTIASGALSPGEPLTNRELDMLELLAQRLQNKEIADRLFVSTETVKSHLKHLYQKLGVHNRRAAVLRAAELMAGQPDAAGDTTDPVNTK